MGSLCVLDPGLASTLQDLGRPGHGAWGVATCGAADPVALRVANRLVGNPDGAPALEVVLRGGRYRLEGPARVAFVGAPFALLRHGPRGAAPLAADRAHDLPAGTELEIGVTRSGARGILAVGGGFAVERTLGSASTHAASGLGGLGGRGLVAGDRLPLAPAPPRTLPRALDAPAALELAAWRSAPHVRATDGSHAARFEADARRRFWEGDHVVSATSDRMGVRLAGPGGAPPAGGRLPSEGLPVGAVEVPSAGQAIVLLPDAPPTGGYPVLACVAAVDLARAGQWRPGEHVRFQRVTLSEARAAYRERMARLDALLPPAPGGPP